MKKNLSDRLTRLEHRIGPATEPKIIRVEYIDSDGAVVPGGYTIEIPFGYEPTSTRPGRQRPRPSASYR
jgi:hypothetical protein